MKEEGIDHGKVSISPMTPKFPLGVYVGNPNNSDPVAEAQFESDFRAFSGLLGAQPQFIDTYVDYRQTTDQWVGNAKFTAASHAQSAVLQGITSVIGLPMASTAPGSASADQFYKDFAAGKYDGVVQGVVKAWADQGFKTQYWRPGWEMNLDSMPFYGGSDAGTQADWRAAFQHVSDVLHAAGRTEGVDVKVVWNPSVTNYSKAGIGTQTLYPGNQYVDVIGADIYADVYPYGDPSAIYDWDKSGQVINSAHPVYDTSVQQWASDPINLVHYYTHPASSQYSLDSSGGHSLSLQDLIDFAKQQGKPIAIAETGSGGSGGAGNGAGLNDNPIFVQWLSDTLSQSGVPVAFVDVWDSNAGGNYRFTSAGDGKPLEAAAWAKYFGATSTAPAPPPVGIGSDTLVLNLSEDAYLGDAQFTISVDGVQLGTAQSVTALHGSGQSQAFTFKGSFGAGLHTASLSFVNDAYGGSAALDRNLYLDSATFNGVQVKGAATLMSNGAVSFSAGTAATPPAPATDTLQLGLAEDAWQGDAQAVITVDGKQAGGTVTVTALHAQGKSQAVTLTGQWGPGAHDVGVQFINDAYGGTAATDRNLYVNGVTLDGQASATPTATLYSNGTAHFATSASPLVLQLSEDAWQGDAQFSVSVDGKALGAAQSVTALHASGAAQDFGFGQAMAAGTHDVAVSFLNDAYGGTATTDRNLYVNAVDVNGAAMPGTAAALLSTGTQHISVVVPAHA